MEAQDIAIYGGLAYLIYRLTRPAEKPVGAGPGGPAYVPTVPGTRPGAPTYVPVPGQPPAQQPVLTVVGQGPPAAPQQTLFEPSAVYEPVAPPAPPAAAQQAAAAWAPVPSPSVGQLLAAPSDQAPAISAAINYAWSQNAPSAYPGLTVGQVNAMYQAGASVQDVRTAAGL